MRFTDVFFSEYEMGLLWQGLVWYLINEVNTEQWFKIEHWFEHAIRSNSGEQQTTGKDWISYEGKLKVRFNHILSFILDKFG
jgi:hypothetical protein